MISIYKSANQVTTNEKKLIWHSLNFKIWVTLTKIQNIFRRRWNQSSRWFNRWINEWNIGLDKETSANFKQVFSLPSSSLAKWKRVISKELLIRSICVRLCGWWVRRIWRIRSSVFEKWKIMIREENSQSRNFQRGIVKLKWFDWLHRLAYSKMSSLSVWKRRKIQKAQKNWEKWCSKFWFR